VFIVSFFQNGQSWYVCSEDEYVLGNPLFARSFPADGVGEVVNRLMRSGKEEVRVQRV
jgi:hypothetical protein